jgi:16S rRNA (uracil1498-N3)-methyltransferase
MMPLPFASIIREKSCLMFSEREGEPLNTDLETKSVNAIIGSEGGWSDEELHQARAAGVPIVTLGGRVLRAETAAIATAALLQHRYGDLK